MIDATCEITHRHGGFWYARVRYNRIIVYNSNFKSKESARAHLAREIEKRNALDGSTTCNAAIRKNARNRRDCQTTTTTKKMG